MNDGCLVANTRIREYRDLAHTASLLVAHHGEIVYERYYRRAEPEDLRCVHSVTKSVISSLVGILIMDGLIALDTPVASVLASPAFKADVAKTAITVRHLLTMTSGLEGGLFGADQRWDIDEISKRGGPVVDGVLQAPLATAPGKVFSYNNGAAHVLSAVIEAVAGKPAGDVAAERLFAPLEIDRWEWPTDPQGHHWGCGSLRLAPRDLLKLGLLYLAGGTWKGGRVLGAAYVRAATAPLRWDGGWPEPGSYGLLWWVAERSAPRMYFAAGHGGQYVIVAPELDLVVVTMADVAAVARPKGWLLRRLVMETIVPAFSTT